MRSSLLSITGAAVKQKGGKEPYPKKKRTSTFLEFAESPEKPVSTCLSILHVSRHKGREKAKKQRVRC